MSIVGRKKIAGGEYEIRADTFGRWTIHDDDGDTIGSGDKLDDAVAMAQSTLTRRKVKIIVPFRTYDGNYGTVTGKHIRTRKILVKINKPGQKNRSEQLDSYYRVFKYDIPQEKIAEYNETNARKQALDSQMREIVKKWGITVGQLADDAIEAATENEMKRAS